MILTCPSCDAQYIIPDESVGPKGRRVKCTTCDYTWRQQPEIVMALDEITFKDSDSSRESTIPRYDPTPIRKSNVAVKSMAKTAASITALMLVLTLLIVIGLRPVVVQNFPSTALLFETIGTAAPIPAKGVTIIETTAAIVKDDKGETILKVSGKLVNETDKNIALPQMIIRMSNKDGWLKDWNDNLYGHSLNAGKSIGFTYDLKKVPENGQNITFLFAD